MRIEKIALLILGIMFLQTRAYALEEISADSFRYLQSLDQRVANVAWRLARSNLELCPRRRPSIGVALHDLQQYAPEYRGIAKSVFGFRMGHPSVLSVAVGSPAQQAGLTAGDVVIAVNGTLAGAPPADKVSVASYAGVESVMQRLEGLAPDEIVELQIERNDKATRITIRPEIVCASRVEVVPGNVINASSDGDLVQVIGRLVLWARSDDELALLVAHELAHNYLGHSRRIESEKISQGMFGAFGASGRALRDMEREADRYSVFMAARAGYDYHIAGAVWRRVAKSAGLGAILSTTHPNVANRGRNADAAVSDVTRLVEDGAQLLP